MSKSKIDERWPCLLWMISIFSVLVLLWMSPFSIKIKNFFVTCVFPPFAEVFLFILPCFLSKITCYHSDFIFICRNKIFIKTTRKLFRIFLHFFFFLFLKGRIRIADVVEKEWINHWIDVRRRFDLFLITFGHFILSFINLRLSWGNRK